MSACRIGFKAMGGHCEIVLDGLAEPDAQVISAPAMAEVLRIEQKFSRYLPQSVVSRINAAAGGESMPIDSETYQLLGYAHAMFEQSRGAFDPTAGVLRRAWRFNSGALPSQSDVQAILPLIGWSKVEVSEQAIRLPVAGMEIDFGGFGKEYAVDRAAAVLESQGVKHGYVNLGGDMRFLGPKADGSPWQIGIQHPRQEGKVLAHIPMEAGGLASSGDYERYIELEGLRYCHILSPHTGWPVEGWQSVSVVASSCLEAGFHTTMTMLKQGDGRQYLRNLGLPYLARDAFGILYQQKSA